MYFLLSLLKPIAIIDINWITKYQSLYKIWSNKNKCKFIVIQHGSYMGGVVTSAAHKYTKCDEFWVWGPHFKEQFEQLNTGKKVQIKVFGNPVLNEIKKGINNSKRTDLNEVLLLPTFLTDEKCISKWEKLCRQIKSIGCQMKVKYHAFQRDEVFREYAHTIPKSTTLHSILKNNYILVISDESSALLDAAFYKQRAVFLQTHDIDTVYSDLAFNVEMIDFNNFHVSITRLQSKIYEQNKLLLNALVFVKDSNSIEETLLS